MTYQSGPGISSPQQYRLVQVAVSSDGQKFANLLPFVEEISLFEDIFAPAVNGFAFIRDDRSMIEYLNISGFNYITIAFNKFGENDTSTAITKLFRVYKVGERVQSSRTVEGYPIYFCSEERLLSEQTKLVKSYPNTIISDVVSDILSNVLKIDPTKIKTIEPTLGPYSFIIPNIKPFEAINWLSTYARPSNTNYIGADMLFFENNNGFYFRSLQSMYAQNTAATYNYNPQNVSSSQTFYNFYTILSYRIIKSFDTLETIKDGGFANKLVSIDPLIRNIKTTTFNFNDSGDSNSKPYFSNSKSLNKFPLEKETKNRLGKTPSQSSDAVFKIAAGNSEQRKFGPIIGDPKNFATTVADIAIETYVPYRTAQLVLSNQVKVEITIPGDPSLCVGTTINLSLPSTASTSKPTDKYYAGKYLITAIRHKIDNTGLYHSIIEASSDSVSAQYSSGSTESLSAG